MHPHTLGEPAISIPLRLHPEARQAVRSGLAHGWTSVILLTVLLAGSGLTSAAGQVPARGDTTTPSAPQPAGDGSGTAPNKPAGSSAAWSVQGPSGGRWVLLWDDEAEVTVTAGDQPLRNLTLAGSTLQSPETGAQLRAGMLKLCGLPTPSDTRASCPAPRLIEAGRPAVLKLRLSPSEVPAGVYTGSLLLAVEGGTGIKPLELRVERTSGWRWFWGGVAIAVGSLLGWLLTVFLRQLNARAAAMVPAAQLRDAVVDLREQERAARELTGFNFTALPIQFAAREAALAVPELEEHGLPPRFANPFTASADGSAYQQYLSAQSTRIAALDVILRIGIAEAMSRWPTASTREPILKALEQLDAAASAHTEPIAAAATVQAILVEMRRGLGGVTKLTDEAALAATATSLPPTREVQVQLQRISLTGWALGIAVTILAGLMVLVINNYGFGTPQDYVKCLFWGLGLPIAGQQLQQLTPGGVFSTLRISLPR